MRKYFITFLALLTVLAISCNNRPTAVSDFTIDTTPITTNEEGVAQRPSIDDTSAVYPVIAVNGDKIILAWQKGNDIYYRVSHNGGVTITKSTAVTRKASNGGTFGNPMRSPHVFFKSDDSVVIIATIGDGTISKNNEQQYNGQTLYAMKGTFGTKSESGTQIAEIKNAYLDITTFKPNDEQYGSPVQGLGKVLMDSANGLGLTSPVTIKSVAGAGRISGSDLVLPLRAQSSSEAKGLKLTSTDGVNWSVKKADTISGFVKNQTDAKYKADLSEFTGTADRSFESAKGSSTEYSITADGKISDGSTTTQVGTRTVEASIAVLSDGNIATFTKEATGLVFRVFSKDKLNGEKAIQ